MNHYIERVKEFRKATGLDQGQSIELHDKLIREELAELADALADSVVVAVGAHADKPDEFTAGWLKYRINNLYMAANVMGISLRESFDIVNKSNMSKLCTIDELGPTADKYREIGVTVKFTEVSDDLWACWSDCDNPDYPRGKLLKSINYHAPDWSGEEWLL